MDEQDIRQRQQALVNVLKERNVIKSALVERAFLQVPRYLFIPGYPLERVYSDSDAIVFRQNEQGVPTSSCSAPDIMAIMLEMLDLQPGQQVLEIGAATGYNAALIGSIVGPQGKVVTIDIQPDLIESAREHLDAAGFAWVRTVAGDGGHGYPEWAPYDRIILTVCPWIIAPAWREQLKEGGRLVLPLDLDGLQKVVAFVRQGDELVSVDMCDCGFMPIQGEYAARAQSVKTQVGPDAGLSITSNAECPQVAENIAGWLKEPPQDMPSGVTVTRDEINISLGQWRPAPEPQDAQDWETVTLGLLAEGDQAGRGDIPALIGFGGQWGKATITWLLPGKAGCAVLVRPPGQAVPLMEWDKPEQDDLPFELYVRRYGQAQEAAEKLLQYLRHWDQAGRPNLDRIAIRAVPADRPVKLNEGEQLRERPWTNLVIHYL